MRDRRLADDKDMDVRDRMSRINILETMQSLMQGVYPSEARLEYLLDHIEGTP